MGRLLGPLKGGIAWMTIAMGFLTVDSAGFVVEAAGFCVAVDAAAGAGAGVLVAVDVAPGFLAASASLAGLARGAPDGTFDPMLRA